MPTLLSPGVSIVEIDLTTIIPAVSPTSACLVGDFPWGPVMTTVLTDQESTLVRNFFQPNDRTFVDWFTAWNFLHYGNSLYITRVVDNNNANTALRATNATVSNTGGIAVYNENDYTNNYSNGQLDTLFNSGEWVAKYPGSLGNSLQVSICPSEAAFESTLNGTLSVGAGNTAVVGVGTLFDTQITSNDLVVINGEIHQIASVQSNTALTLATRHVTGAQANVSLRRWEYYNEVNLAPDTTHYANAYGVTDDEIHVVVIDEDGRWTGTPGEVLEVHRNLSLAYDATAEDGTSIYYPNWINRSSRYIWWASHNSGLTNAGTNISHNVGGDTPTTFGRPALPIVHSLVGGNDGAVPVDGHRMLGYDLYSSPDVIDVSIILGSKADATLATYLINDIAEARMDSVAFLSPPMATVVNNIGSELHDIVTFRNSLPSSSYAFMDSGWKLMYDKYNDVYRWVPLNGDIAGLFVRTANTRDPWWSFAGLNRGQIKNVTRLSWNPSQSERDQLYKNSINPVVTFPGDGTVLFGDKTLLAKPSAFDRINVRFLFIVLEKAIGRASRYTLFEFNDAFTQASFRNMVEPYLRDVQGRRGIYDFKVICDSTNNTPEVIDNKAFKADIYIKPARAIDFIYLSFVAVRTGVAFSEIVGQVGV